MISIKSKPKVLFLAQCFESKGYADSAGYSEVIAPMMASGLLGEVEVSSWGKDLDFFHHYIAQEIAAISDRIVDDAVVVYGAGAHSEEFFRELSGLKIMAFSDTNPALWGQTFLGLPVVAPEEISDLAKHVVVSSRVWDQEITRQLRANDPKLSIYPLYEGLMAQNRCFLQNQVNTVIERYSKDQFDLIFYCPANPAEAFTQENFAQLRNHFDAKFATIWWDYDDSNATNEYMQFERCSLAYSDIIVDPGNYSKTERLKSLKFPYHLHTGVNKVHVLPTAFDPQTFFPRPKDWSAPIAMFGSLVGERRKWKHFLEENYPRKFRHFGGVYQGQAPLPMTEYAKLVSVTPIIVNTQTYEFRSQCKGKVREVLACAGLLLEQENLESRAYFDGLDCIEYFSDQRQLGTLIDYYLMHPKEATERAFEAHRWYQENWSAEPWTRKLLQVLE